MSTTGPTVSIIIVTWNSAAVLQRCLAALERQTFRDFEVIVVDNGSSDDCTEGLASSAPSLDLHLEHLNANLGFAAATNIGARLARGSWLALLNPDAFAEPDWLQRLMQVAEGTQGYFFACRQVQDARPRLLDGEGDMYHASGLALRRNFNYPVLAAGTVRGVFSACAAAALYPRQAFLDAGGLDEDYFAYYEDVDLGFRLRLRGLNCLMVPSAVVRHIGSAATGRGSATSTYYGQRNLIWTFLKDMPSPWVWVYLPFHVALNVSLVIYLALTGRGVAALRGKFDALRGIRRALAKRAAVQAELRVPVAAVMATINRNPFAVVEGWFVRHYPPRR